DIHEHTLVDFLTPANGDSLILNGTDDVVMNYLWEIDPTWPDHPLVSWDISNLNIVAFVQNDATMEVLQAEDSRASDLHSDVTINTVLVPVNSESIGPFDMDFSIVDNSGNWTGLKQLHYSVNSNEDSLALVNTSGDDWQANLPIISGITGTSELLYWISIDDASGDQYRWPPGAPANYQTMIFGPDTTAPELTGLDQELGVHYLIPFEKEITIAGISDDRFNLQAPDLLWRVGQGSEQSVTMVLIDSVYENWNWKYSWKGSISGQTTALDDSVYYWVTASDMSQSQNIGTSQINSFGAGLVEVIGDWESPDNYSDITYWNSFDHGYFQPFNIPGLAMWENIITEHMTEDYGNADTLNYNRALDFTAIDAAWLMIPMTHNFRSADNHGYLEISVNGTDWDILETYSSTATTYPAVFQYDLSTYAGSSTLFVRLRVERITGSLEWMIDDIVLHSDPNLLETEAESIMPGQIKLYQNYPNPFNPVTLIQYVLPQRSEVQITIYDLLGRQVTTLVSEAQDAGYKSVKWNATNDLGQPVSAGVYFYQIRSGAFVQTRKMILLK
ncbi:MAG: T9SS type A sorting domain-containing protein, partial [Candidatus Marinimicrobia bacterium]|nr:T9SS type A sorting domain-containing protein [Candidatus Neomarinimicrobiota bacterium]